MSLLLFDIDGTLLLSGGAGIRAMTAAFEELFGVPEAFAASDVAGRTDSFILGNALLAAGLPDTPEQHQRFREAYIKRLRDEIGRSPTGRYGLMPGVAPLINQLRTHDSIHLALLTGNFEPAAYVKLAHFELGGIFSWGAFGEESSDRNELGRIAMRRAEEKAVPAHARERAVVIGDTPHDVDCAHAIGARILAVATGNYSIEQLKESGADVVLSDLSDTERVMRVLGLPAVARRPG